MDGRPTRQRANRRQLVPDLVELLRASPPKETGRRRWPIVLAVVLALLALLALAGYALAVTRYLPLVDDAKSLKTDVQGSSRSSQPPA